MCWVDLEGFCVCFLMLSFVILMNCFEGFSWGCVWHYSPLDREEVAMLGVGLSWTSMMRVSFHGERRERG